MNPRKSRMLGNLQVKPCMLPNLAWLITAEVPYGKFLRMSNYQGSSKPKNLFVFSNNAPQNKAVAVNKKRKIHFLPDTSALTCALIQADASIGSVLRLHCSLSSVPMFLQVPPSETANRLPANWRLSIQDVFRHSVTLHFSDKLKQSGRCMLVESSSVWDVRFPSSKALGGYSTQF